MSRRTILDRILAKGASVQASQTSRAFFRAAKRATAVQERLLATLLARAAGSEIGRRHDMASIRGYEDFRRAVPVYNYQRLAPFIDRVRDGDASVLFSPNESVLMFALTSGTTAEPKYIPVTQAALADCRAGWNIWGVRAIMDHPPSLLRCILQVTSPMNDHLSPGGVPCGAITGLLAATQKKLVRRYYTSTPAVADIKDATAKYYTIMRLAAPRDVSWAVTANPATLLLLAKTADAHRDALIRDVRDGTLNDAFEVDGRIRDGLRPRMAADVEAARRLDRLVAKHGGLYPRHIWRLDFLAHWTGGTMGLYRPQLRQYWGDAPVRDIGLIASEGRMSIPIEDETASGVAAVTSQFLEFVPESAYGGDDPSVLRSHEVHEGETYFLLLTNASGLWRYDIGDRVRVTGWVGEAPLIEFLSRDAHSSSLTGEKLTEDQVVGAMAAACRADGGPAVDQFVLVPQWGDPPSYLLYAESAALGGHRNLAAALDAALAAANPEYASKRQTLRLGPVRVCELAAGAMAEREKGLRRQRARTAEQFKHQFLFSAPGLEQESELQQFAVDAAEARA